MKKLLVLCGLLCLVGCASEPEKKTVVCEGQLNGGLHKVTLNAEDDTVLVQTTESELDFGTLGVTKEQVDQEIKKFEDIFNMKGLEYTHSVEDTVLKEKISIDYQTADFKELLTKGIVESDSNEATYVSLEKTVKGLESQGYTCK